MAAGMDIRDERTPGQLRHGVLHAQHRAEDIEFDHAHELGGVHQVVRRQRTSAAGVRDDTVQHAEGVHRLGNESLDVGLSGYVGHDLMDHDHRRP